MDSLYYMIYILVFIIGLIIGLLASYGKHMEPFIISEIDIVSLVLAVVGWFLLLNYGIIGFISPVILLVIAFFGIAYAIGARPGYGRRETAIGIVVAVIAWIFTSGVLF